MNNKDIEQYLEGFEPEDIANTFYDMLNTLILNDSEYFSGGRGDSLIKTLELTKQLIRSVQDNKVKE